MISDGGGICPPSDRALCSFGMCPAVAPTRHELLPSRGILYTEGKCGRCFAGMPRFRNSAQFSSKKRRVGAACTAPAKFPRALPRTWGCAGISFRQTRCQDFPLAHAVARDSLARPASWTTKSQSEPVCKKREFEAAPCWNFRVRNLSLSSKRLELWATKIC